MSDMAAETGATIPDAWKRSRDGEGDIIFDRMDDGRLRMDVTHGYTMIQLVLDNVALADLIDTLQSWQTQVEGAGL